MTRPLTFLLRRGFQPVRKTKEASAEERTFKLLVFVDEYKMKLNVTTIAKNYRASYHNKLYPLDFPAC